MIEKEIIIWIINLLKYSRNSLSEYTLEYSTALFMNLSMRIQGKIKCEEPKEEVLSVLIDLIESDNQQVRTFVNGTLYSLFSRSSIRQKAKEMGMNEFLISVM